MQAFRRAHIPPSIMSLKKKEFRALRQGSRSVNEYLHKFNQLACYASEDVTTDEAKQECFLEGLNDDLAVLIAQDYSDFQQLVSKAIRQEGKHIEMENCKRKKASQKFNSRGFPKPRIAQPQTPQRRTFQSSPSKAPAPAQRPISSGFRNTSLRSQFPKKAPTTSTAGVTCFYCNEVGHYANKCPKKQQAATPA